MGYITISQDVQFPDFSPSVTSVRYDIIMLQVTWLLLVLVLHSESRVLVKRSFKDQSVKAYLTEVLRHLIYYRNRVNITNS